MGALRTFAWKHWWAVACGFGSCSVWLLIYATPAQMRDRAMYVAIVSLGCALTGMLMRARPRPEWAHGKPAKGRP